jgi:hypothetical protein
MVIGPPIASERLLPRFFQSQSSNVFTITVIGLAIASDRSALAAERHPHGLVLEIQPLQQQRFEAGENLWFDSPTL